MLKTMVCCDATQGGKPCAKTELVNEHGDLPNGWAKVLSSRPGEPSDDPKYHMVEKIFTALKNSPNKPAADDNIIPTIERMMADMREQIAPVPTAAHLCPKHADHIPAITAFDDV